MLRFAPTVATLAASLDDLAVATEEETAELCATAGMRPLETRRFKLAVLALRGPEEEDGPMEGMGSAGALSHPSGEEGEDGAGEHEHEQKQEQQGPQDGLQEEEEGAARKLGLLGLLRRSVVSSALQAVERTADCGGRRADDGERALVELDRAVEAGLAVVMQQSQSDTG